MTDRLSELNRALFEDPMLRSKTVVRRVGDTWAVFRPVFEIAGSPRRTVEHCSTHALALAIAVNWQPFVFGGTEDD